MTPRPVEAQPALVVEVAILIPASTARDDVATVKELIDRLGDLIGEDWLLQVRGVRWS